LPACRIRTWTGLSENKYYSWKKRYGKKNEHNGQMPKKHWITEEEREAIVGFCWDYDLEGYRRLSFMMLDADVAAVSPSTVYRMLKEAGELSSMDWETSKKGTGFEQLTEAHQHWHMDVSYLNIKGTFYYFCGVLDGYSRAILHWEIKEQMKEEDVEFVLQRAAEKYPRTIGCPAPPRVVSDNGPQFVARDFKAYVRLLGMDHVRTSPYYPQSNGKIERVNQILKTECIRRKVPPSLEEARRVVGEFVAYYNEERLHSAIGSWRRWIGWRGGKIK
jgi:transposase InsO family protein